MRFNIYADTENKIVIETQDYNDLGNGVVENSISIGEAIAIQKQLSEAIFKIQKPIINDEIRRFQLRMFHEIGVHPTTDKREHFEKALGQFLMNVLVG